MGFQTTLNTVAAIVTITGVIIGLIQYAKSQPWKEVAKSFGITFVIVLVILLLARLIPSPPASASGSSPVSTQTASTSQPGGITPTQGTDIPSSPTPTPTPIPPTSTPHDEKMEWTTNWSDWGATGDNWYISGSNLMATGNGQMVITAPLVPISTDYDVEVDITVDNVNHGAYYGGFGIVVRANAGWGGYALTMCYAGGWNSCQGSSNAAILSAGCDFTQYVVGGQGCSVLGATPYHAPYHTKVTYRLEVRGNNIQGFVNGGPLFPATVDNTYHTAGQICLFSQNIGLTVTRFTYIPLS